MGLVNPVSNILINSSCEKALSGWPCDPEMEKLRDLFARETDLAKLKEIAEAAQLRAFEWTPLRPSRRMAPDLRRAQERHGVHLGRPDRLLERREEVESPCSGVH